MLPKPNRLPGYLIPPTLNSPHTLKTPFFVLKHHSLKSHFKAPQIGFIVSTKIAKRAVDRNKLKRLLRQSLKPHLSSLKPGQYLFLARHPLKSTNLKNLTSLIKKSLSKAKLINEKNNS